MDILLITLKSIYGAFFVFAGVMHVVKPNFFQHFIPKGLPKLLVNYVVGALEALVGIGMFIPSLTTYASLGIIVLLLLFLPIHFWDLTRDRPAIGSKQRAIIRIPFQFVLIFGAYYIYTNS